MGYYINPPNISKEQFLSRKGTPITAAQALAHKFDGESYPVCLVDNDIFTTAAIAYCACEAQEFARKDGRPRQWYLVSAADLEPYYRASP